MLSVPIIFCWIHKIRFLAYVKKAFPKMPNLGNAFLFLWMPVNPSYAIAVMTEWLIVILSFVLDSVWVPFLYSVVRLPPHAFGNSACPSNCKFVCYYKIVLFVAHHALIQGGCKSYLDESLWLHERRIKFGVFMRWLSFGDQSKWSASVQVTVASTISSLITEWEPVTR